MSSRVVAPRAEFGSVPEIESLKRRDDFRRVYQRGARADASAEGLALRYVAAGGTGPRFGFQIKKKRVRRSRATA